MAGPSTPGSSPAASFTARSFADPPFIVVVPARYASSRLPGKPLVDLAGRPMLAHVHERALASGAEAVIVATDDARVRAAAEAFGARVVMTAAGHRSGTERIAEVVTALGLPPDALIVNVQGDEPLLPPALVRQVAANLAARPAVRIATLCEPIDDARAVFDPGVVKVVTDHEDMALYFSRAPVPWHRDGFAADREALPGEVRWLRHLGIYAYRAGYLAEYVAAAPAALERAEALEQLRALDRGDRIHVARACEPAGPGVDTPADLEHVRRLLAGAASARPRAADP